MNLPDFYSLLQQQGFGFTTDSRNLKHGDVYFALTGPNFNGNEFAKKALNDGASYAVVDDNELLEVRGCIVVEDVLSFLQELARYHRDQFDIPVLAIGGSNGKTTTKELIISVLKQKVKVHGTKGNLNNLIGVPITLLEMPNDTEIAVIEIGTNQFGEIAKLCEIVNPNFGLITNIGKEHLEGFGNLEGVAKEESALYYYLMKQHGMAFVNADDEWLMRMAGRMQYIFTYGQSKEADCSIQVQSFMPEIKLQLGETTMQSPLFGIYNFQNIAAAVAVGVYFRVDEQQISKGIETYKPSNNRSEIRKVGSTTLILDYYNANPSSMELALRSFATLENTRKVAVLGDMFELGDQESEEHKIIAQIASDLRFDEVVLIGKRFSPHAASIGANGFDTMEEAIRYIKSLNLANTWMLIKGSRGMQMEQIPAIWDNKGAKA